MAQPVKLSDSLINSAREASSAANRSLAAQVEHWAALGRAIEGRLTIDQTSLLKSQIREPTTAPYASGGAVQSALRLALLDALQPSTQQVLAAELAASGMPRFSTDPAFPGCLVRENTDGTRTTGRWTNGRFEMLKEDEVKASQAPARQAP
jgi:hypothetical protein